MITRILLLFIVIISTLSYSCRSKQGDMKEDAKEEIIEETKSTYEGYIDHNISGFNFYVEEQALESNTKLTNEAINKLKDDLTEISELKMSSEVIEALKMVPIFVDWNTSDKGAEYHPSKDWLINNGYRPEKAMGVEIANVDNFVNWSDLNQPYIILHEMAHAYHHRALNFDDLRITQAFNNAQENGLYQKVQYHSGNGNYSIADRAYALANEKEYFAEITEAYFGTNDFFPFNFDDLKEYDPTGFEVLEAIWGDQ